MTWLTLNRASEQGKKGDFSDFECGMVFDMSQAGLTISEIFVPTYPSLWFTENC